MNNSLNNGLNQSKGSVFGKDAGGKSNGSIRGHAPSTKFSALTYYIDYSPLEAVAHGSRRSAGHVRIRKFRESRHEEQQIVPRQSTGARGGNCGDAQGAEFLQEGGANLEH